MSPVVQYLLGVCVPYLLRIILYITAFKIRKITCSLINCFVIGGAFILAGLIPLPQFLYLLVTMGASLVLITKYTDAELYPDAIFISTGVELGSIFVMDLLIAPLIF